MRGAFHFEVEEDKELVLEDETGLLILKDRADFSRLFTLFCPPLLPESLFPVSCSLPRLLFPKPVITNERCGFR